MRAMLVLAAGAAMLAGCAQYGRHGLMRTARFHALPCEGIDAERAHVESEAARLYARARAKRVFDRPDAQAGKANWPVFIYTRGAGWGDRQRYQQLSKSYEHLRIAARQRGCALTFAPDVSATVGPAAAG